MSITASMVKELRERTGAGMMECKKALTEAGGDMEAAIVSMRKRGQAKAAKRADKTAAEGVIVQVENDARNAGLMIEINSETDFVARDANFKEFSNMVITRGIQAQVDDVDVLMALPVVEGEAMTIEQRRQELVSKIGENVKVRRLASLQSTGIVGKYLHGNRIGVLVAIDKDEPELARDLAMHIAASNPQAIDENDLPAELVQKEREIFSAQAKESGKPDDIIAKMVDGRIAKFLKEICLVGQPFVKDPNTSIANLLKQHNAKVLQFIRFEVGEGIEKETVDFAEEVKAQVQGSE